MKSKKEIQENLILLIEKRLKIRLKKMLCRVPKNCVHSRIYEIQNEKREKDDSVVLCELNRQNGIIFECNERFCNKCSDYSLRHTRKSVEEDFMKDISNPQVCSQKEPKIAMLLWILQEEKKEIKNQNWLKKILNVVLTFLKLKPSGFV